MADYSTGYGMGGFDPQAEQINRQRQMANLLRTQSLSPLDSQVVAGRVIPISPFQGLAKIAQGLAAGQMENQASQQQQDYMTQRANQREQSLADFQKTLQGTPEQKIQSLAPTIGNTPENPQTQTVPAVAPNPQAAYAQLLRSNDPALAQLGMQGLASLPQLEAQKQAREETRQFQKDQLQAQLEARKEAQQAQFANQRQMAQVMAGLRQPQSPVAILGPDNKPMYVPPSMAYGQQPYNAAAEQRQLTAQQQKAQNEISSQQALDQAAALYAHPGREMGTGASSFMSMIPGTEARGFKANLDTFKAQTFIPMVSALKGMGALSDAEGKKLSDSVGALDPSMPEKEFAKSLQQITRTLYSKAKTAGLNVSLPDFASQTPAQGQVMPSGLPSQGDIEAEIRRRQGMK